MDVHGPGAMLLRITLPLQPILVPLLVIVMLRPPASFTSATLVIHAPGAVLGTTNPALIISLLSHNSIISCGVLIIVIRD